MYLQDIFEIAYDIESRLHSLSDTQIKRFKDRFNFTDFKYYVDEDFGMLILSCDSLFKLNHFFGFQYEVPDLMIYTGSSILLGVHDGGERASEILDLLFEEQD